MFPLKDNVPSGSFPLITYIIIGINVWVLWLEMSAANLDAFLGQRALVPSLIDLNNLYTLTPFLTSMFLHAGLLHLLSNMWFLYIFGDNVEGDLGSFAYALFYLAGGIVSAATQFFFLTGQNSVLLGASGAVAAVLGYYYVRFPHHRVKTLITFGIIFFTDLSATTVLGLWFVLQLISGFAGIDASGGAEGIAWWAHIGGFIFGIIIAKLFASRPNQLYQN